jgi:hypothetical protein
VSSEKRFEMRVAGGFNVKIDNELMKMFVMPVNNKQWYVPKNSMYKYKLRAHQFTELETVTLADGTDGLRPKTYIMKELI